MSTNKQHSLSLSGNSSLEFAWVYVCMSLMPGEAAASPDASVPGLKQPEGAATRGWGADWDLKAHTLPWLKCVCVEIARACRVTSQPLHLRAEQTEIQRTLRIWYCLVVLELHLGWRVETRALHYLFAPRVR